MYKVKADEAKNILYITVAGNLSHEEAEKAKESIEFSVKKLQPGFCVINDISKFIYGDEKAGNVLKEIMIIFIKYRVKHVVRVIGTSKSGLIQFANNSIQVESYKLHYVPSLKEAEELLHGENKEG